MAFTNYTELQAAVARWLNRDDLTTDIVDFIALAEADIKRRLRRRATRVSFSIASAANALPAACKELRSVRLNTGVAGRDKPIPVVTKEAFDTLRTSLGTAGRPQVACVVDGELLVLPDPDTTYTAEIVYYHAYTAPATTPTNSDLTDAPDLFLFGALLQAEPFLANDERIGMWQSRYESALNQLNLVREREEYGAAVPFNPPVTIG